MPKIITAEVRRQQDEARERVKWVLSNVYEGRQRRMADAMGVPQSQISRIVNEQLGVSPDFLAALARLPELNPDWVRRGLGDPMLPNTKGTLPVALGVLPGVPQAFPQLLTGHRHPVADSLERETRYWLEVQPASPLVWDASLRMCPGDLLLVEADKDWTTRPEYVIGRLCGVRLALGSNEPSYVLGRISEDAVGLLLDVIRGFLREVASPFQNEKSANKPHRKRNVKVRRKIRFLDDEERKAEARRQAHAQPSPIDRVDAQDIVGVCVYLVRPQPSPTSAMS